MMIDAGSCQPLAELEIWQIEISKRPKKTQTSLHSPCYANQEQHEKIQQKVHGKDHCTESSYITVNGQIGEMNLALKLEARKEMEEEYKRETYSAYILHVQFRSTGLGCGRG